MAEPLPLVKGTLHPLVLEALARGPMHEPRARCYRPTVAGRAHLAAGTACWVRHAEAATGILTAPAPG